MVFYPLTDDFPESFTGTTSHQRRMLVRRRTFTYLIIAVFSGIIFQLCIIVMLGDRGSSLHHLWGKLEPVYLSHDPNLPWNGTIGMATGPTGAQDILSESSIHPHDWLSESNTIPHGWETREGKNDMDLEKLREMVSGTKGYFSRDWSVGLGWNNVRYIIEAALLQSRLLNRTLVIPSFVYARACEYSSDICSAYATLVDRERAVGWDSWGGAPLSTLAWHIPIEVMLDLPHLRRIHPVVLTSEYLELQGLSPDIESLAGDWDHIGYHDGPLAPTLQVIPNEDYDPEGIIRVDWVYSNSVTQTHAENMVNVYLEEKLGARLGYEADEARRILIETGIASVEALETEEDLEAVLNQGGWGFIHTFKGAGGTHFAKTVVEPTFQIVSFARCRGFVNDFDSSTVDVLLLEGETHLRRQPGQMSFTTALVRDMFAGIVLHNIRPTNKVRILANRIDERLRGDFGGRMWIGAHMRRGDFVTVNMVHSSSLEDHFAKIKAAVEKGRQRLLEINSPAQVNNSDAEINPVSPPDNPMLPEENQPFYLATDERSPEGMQHLRENGAMLIEDILTIDDRRLLGWPLLLTDVLAVVEQTVLARSDFFVGYAKSSVAGGVINMRAALGKELGTTMLDT